MGQLHRDPQKPSPIRPLGDWIVVHLNRPAESKIWVPPSQEDRIRTGVILQTGPGRTSKKGKLIPMEAQKGMKVAFFRENFETMHGKTLIGFLRQLDEDIGIIQERDILYIIEEN
jgi:co-chaperonin GroES (HSP10)